MENIMTSNNEVAKKVWAKLQADGFDRGFYFRKDYDMGSMARGSIPLIYFEIIEDGKVIGKTYSYYENQVSNLYKLALEVVYA